jgi:hypothetical protein
MTEIEVDTERAKEKKEGKKEKQNKIRMIVR